MARAPHVHEASGAGAFRLALGNGGQDRPDGRAVGGIAVRCASGPTRRDDDLVASTCADALIRRGRDWSAEFVRLATEARFRGESQRGVGEVVALVSAAIAAHDLPMPLTETYVRGWVSLITFAHSYAMADNRRDWHPLVDMTAQEGTARPAYNLSENLTLSECLAGTRSLSELLVAGLATPNALLDWAGFREEGWAVGPAIRYAVSTGLVDRQPLLDGTFSALSRDDRANNQRVLAEFLKALDPTPAEIKHRASLILHVLPTVQGSVTKPLLEMALAADIGLDQRSLGEAATLVQRFYRFAFNRQDLQ